MVSLYLKNNKKKLWLVRVTRVNLSPRYWCVGANSFPASPGLFFISRFQRQNQRCSWAIGWVSRPFFLKIRVEFQRAFNSYNFVTTSWHSQRRRYTQTLKPDLNNPHMKQIPDAFQFLIWVFINLSLFPYFSIYYLYFPNMLILHEIYTHICSFLWLCVSEFVADLIFLSDAAC